MGFFEDCVALFNATKGRALKKIVEKLKRRLCLVEEDMPADVKEGQFAVYAVDDDGESHRFVVGLDCLVHPEFLRLLALAAEEFGLEREGALLIPCRPGKLERILGEGRRRNFGCGRGILTRKL